MGRSMGKRTLHKLSARKVERESKPGRYADGGGLWLQVSEWQTKSWLFQYTSPVTGRVRQYGLGALHTVSLAQAREDAHAARLRVRDGVDPVEARRSDRDQRRLEKAKHVTFKDCAESYIARHGSTWRNGKHREQWNSTLETYAYPIIGDLPVAQIDTALVVKVLEPIWNTKAETAGRLRGRIERILDAAKVRHQRTGDNPARWKGHLKELLPAVSKVKAVRHHPALPYAEIPQFMTELRSNRFISARALEFTILTAARTNETIGATRDEIDLKAKTWTIPATRMKMGKEHRVPLCERALAILSELPREPGNPHLFVGAVKGKPLSNMAMLELMKGMRPGYVPHGFRSTFMDWAHERTRYPKVVIDKALAHKVSDAVEEAYRRGDLFDKRRLLMVEWGRFCEQMPQAEAADKVTAIRAKKSKAS
jgi:integrase